ncbi:transposase [Nocardia macrotermitis]|uniref:DUF4351 domain-containing protein n=1 Tax=Nocardia macrotermitis TaxID=2585198 RepID=A0A7K0CY20_9NOCA|nr:transposase [Nocardia macrotermitis]MQY18397.1 hypothetical protein [Nocardia macrotermitis]
MTTAEQLEARGYAKGFKEGYAEGLAEGQAIVLIHLLTIKFGPLTDQIVNRVEAADTAPLQRWGGLMLIATSLDEVFG